MKFKNVMKYQIMTSGKSVLMYYGIYLMVVFALILLMSVSGGNNGSINNMEFSSAIFLFVSGLNSLKQDLHFFLANGLTRRTLFLSVVMSGGLMAVGMVMLDYVCRVVLDLFITNQNFTNNLYFLAFPNQPAYLAYVYMFAFYLFVFFLGFATTNIYYALNKLGKTLFSVSVPMLLFVALPYIDSTYFHYSIMSRLKDWIIAGLGLYPNNQPWIGVGMFTLVSAVFAIFSYFLMRRTTLKQA